MNYLNKLHKELLFVQSMDSTENWNFTDFSKAIMVSLLSIIKGNVQQSKTMLRSDGFSVNTSLPKIHPNFINFTGMATIRYHTMWTTFFA